MAQAHFKFTRESVGACVLVKHLQLPTNLFFLKPLDFTSKYHGNTMGTWILKVVTPFYYKSRSLIRKFHACWYRAASGAVSFWVWYRVRRLSPAAAGITTKIWVICHQPSTRLTVKKTIWNQIGKRSTPRCLQTYVAEHGNGKCIGINSTKSWHQQENTQTIAAPPHFLVAHP